MSDLDKQIIKLWKDDKSYTEIAEKLFCSHPHVSKVISDYKRKRRLAGMAAVEIYFAGKSAKEAIENVRGIMI